MPAKQLENPCVDCNDAESTVKVRARHLCRDCFIRYVDVKVIRRMAQYRLLRNSLKEGRQRLLLLLSLGTSSSVLLHSLSSQLERLHAKGPHSPLPYELYVLVIEPSTISEGNASGEDSFDAVQKRYLRPSYTKVPFYSIFEHDPSIAETLAQFAGENFKDDASLSNEERLKAFRSAISTPTSQVDVDSILITRLAVAFAKKFDCHGILWGDSDTRLAAKALANVAKGRGASVTWQVSDGVSPWGIEFSFPLRDVFKTELNDYANLIPELQKIIIPDAPVSENVLTKNLSIDELMMRYVQTQGAKYPGVMANVTRTVNKLVPSSSNNLPQCTFCGATIGGGVGSIPVEAHQLAEGGAQFCYGCARSCPDLAN